jgi:hypothetical protein
MSSEIKRYFIYVHFRDSSKMRLVASAKSLQLVMKAYFSDAFKVAFMTQDAIGFFVKTSMHPHGINDALVSPDQKKVNLIGDPIVSEDELLVLEIGDEFSVKNLGSAQGWLSAK